MDDIRCYQFFLEPSVPLHRRYEALRAVFVEARPQQEMADRFGYSSATLRQMVYEFRSQCRNETAPPFFLTPALDDQRRTTHRETTTTRRLSPIAGN